MAIRITYHSFNVQRNGFYTASVRNDFVNLNGMVMKKIIMALAVVGFTCAGAQAQTKKCVCPASKTAKVHKAQKMHKVAHVARPQPKLVSETRTYQVCREQGGYYTCCLYKNTTTKPVGEKSLAVR